MFPLPLGMPTNRNRPSWSETVLSWRVSTKSDPENRQLWTMTPAKGRLVFASRTTPSITLPGFAVYVKSEP